MNVMQYLVKFKIKYSNQSNSKLKSYMLIPFGIDENYGVDNRAVSETAN